MQLPQTELDAVASSATPKSAQMAPAGPPTLRLLSAEDIRRWQRIFCPQETRFVRAAIKLTWSYCGLRATLLYRISHALWRGRIPLLPNMISRLNITLHGLDIPPHIPIGPGLYVPHPVGTVITAKAIGANVTLISGITIGMRNLGEFPVIEDSVFIGAGARVLGGITVGAGASIGANAVVLRDVPSGATAVGVPAVIKTPRMPQTNNPSEMEEETG